MSRGLDRFAWSLDDSHNTNDHSAYPGSASRDYLSARSRPSYSSYAAARGDPAAPAPRGRREDGLPASTADLYTERARRAREAATAGYGGHSSGSMNSGYTRSFYEDDPPALRFDARIHPPSSATRYAPPASRPSTFRVANASPSQRRALVSELRMEAMRTGLSGVRVKGLYEEDYPHETTSASLSEYRPRAGRPAPPPAAPYGGGRPLPQMNNHSYVSEPSSILEDDAERGLAELTRSTDQLRKLGKELMDFAAAYNGGRLPVVERREEEPSVSSPEVAIPVKAKPVDRPLPTFVSEPAKPIQQEAPLVVEAPILPAKPVEEPPAAAVVAPPVIVAAPAPPATVAASLASPEPAIIVNHNAVAAHNLNPQDVAAEKARRRALAAQREAAEREALAEKAAASSSSSNSSRFESKMAESRAEEEAKVAPAEPAAVPAPSEDFNDALARKQAFLAERRAKAEAAAAAAAATAEPPAPPAETSRAPAEKEPEEPYSKTATTLITFGKTAPLRAGKQGSWDDLDQLSTTSSTRPLPALGGLKSRGRSASDTILRSTSADNSRLSENNASFLSASPTRSPSSRGALSNATSKRSLASTRGLVSTKNLPTGLTSGGSANQLPAEVGPPIEMEGYLDKTSGPKGIRGLIKWQRRYFILSGRFLMYTNEEGSTEAKRLLDLERIEVLTNLSSFPRNAPTRHMIAIAEMDNKRLLTLCASSHDEILAWYQGIVRNISLCCLKSGAVSRYPSRSLPPINPGEPVDDAQARREARISFYRKALPQPPKPVEMSFAPHYVPPPTYYDNLGVPPDASSGVIKRAYRKIALDSHPDRNPGADQQNFALVARAYETLIDEASRAQYDLKLRVADYLRSGIHCIMYLPRWTDADLLVEPKDRTLRENNTIRTPALIFTDGELKCLYWQIAPADPEEAARVALAPRVWDSVEMRFVQMVLYFRDVMNLPQTLLRRDPNQRVAYEDERVMAVIGDRLHSGPLIFEFETPEQCQEVIQGMRLTRVEHSVLFKQNLEKLQEGGIR